MTEWPTCLHFVFQKHEHLLPFELRLHDKATELAALFNGIRELQHRTQIILQNHSTVSSVYHELTCNISLRSTGLAPSEGASAMSTIGT